MPPEVHRLPVDWRARLARVIAGIEEPDPSWFTGSETLTAGEQIDIYREQYELRLVEALSEQMSGTAALLGDEAEALFLAFLRARPSTSWTLNQVGHLLPDWLAERRGSSPLTDMARLDRAVSEVFSASEAQVPSPEGLSLETVLRLQPHVRLLRLDHDVHRVRAGLLDGPPPEPAARIPVHLVVYRAGVEVRHLVVHPVAWELLHVLEGGATLAGAVDAVLDQGADPQLLTADLGPWFQLFASRGLLAAS